MRTTIRIDDHLAREAKRIAVQTNQTLGAVVEEGLRILLAHRRTRGKKAQSPLVTFRGGGLQPGIDLDDSASLLDVMERRDDPL